MGKHKQVAKQLRKERQELLAWVKARRENIRMLRDAVSVDSCLWAFRNCSLDALDMVIRRMEGE